MQTENNKDLATHFDRKYNNPLSVISTKLKLSNISYENIKNYHLDEDAVNPESISPYEKWIMGYRSDIEVEKSVTEANGQKRLTENGESKFLRSGLCRPVPISERAVQVKMARKNHEKRPSLKILEGLYDAFAPGLDILKVCFTNSTIKDSDKAVVTVRNGDMAKLGTLKGRQTPLKVNADRRGSQNSEKLIEEHTQSHIKEHTTNLKWDKKIRQRNFIISLQYCTRSAGAHSKFIEFPALRIQLDTSQPYSPDNLIIPSWTALGPKLRRTIIESNNWQLDKECHIWSYYNNIISYDIASKYIDSIRFTADLVIICKILLLVLYTKNCLFVRILFLTSRGMWYLCLIFIFRFI